MSKEMEKRDQGAVEAFQPDAMMPADLFEPVGFRDLVLHQQSYANQVLAKVADVVGDAAFGKGAYDGMKKEARYVVQMGDDLKKAIEEGKVKLDYKKTGEIFAQLRDASGHFGEKLPIKKELIAAGIDPLSVGNALQMKAIEQKLNAMIDTLEDIGQDVSEVIQGQHNDRIGLFNSGLNLYLESRNIQNPDFRMLVVAQALKSLSDGNEQILQALRADASYLLEGKYKLKKGRSAEEIQERMIDIKGSLSTPMCL